MGLQATFSQASIFHSRYLIGIFLPSPFQTEAMADYEDADDFDGDDYQEVDEPDEMEEIEEGKFYSSMSGALICGIPFPKSPTSCLPQETEKAMVRMLS